MSKKLFFLVSFIFMLGVVSPAMGQDDPSLMGWWTFDSHSNDVSGNGRHRTLIGNPSFGPGVFGDGTDADCSARLDQTRTRRIVAVVQRLSAFSRQLHRGPSRHLYNDSFRHGYHRHSR